MQTRNVRLQPSCAHQQWQHRLRWRRNFSFCQRLHLNCGNEAAAASTRILQLFECKVLLPALVGRNSFSAPTASKWQTVRHHANRPRKMAKLSFRSINHSHSIFRQNSFRKKTQFEQFRSDFALITIGAGAHTHEKKSHAGMRTNGKLINSMHTVQYFIII